MANHLRGSYKTAKSSEYVGRQESFNSMSQYQFPSETIIRKRRTPQDMSSLPSQPSLPAQMSTTIPMSAPEMPGGRRRKSVYDQEMKEQLSVKERNLWENNLNARLRRSPQDFPMPPIPEFPSRRRRSPEDMVQKMDEMKQKAQEKGAEAKEKASEGQEKAQAAGESGKAMAESAKEKMPSGK
ncbi:uncharacterized protein isoform X2 [Rhodnius prolixus]|uniref:uncharacterized protein isoform X2 n=1 Tax=Rhodnius prolixus TaxID=13249 RepID=UPI003D18DAE0